MQQLPQAVAYVHERGAPHMVDPTKLLVSATRLYGANMDWFWGEFRPVPEDRLRVLRGGEQLDLAGRTLQVQYTPGHASHHVSYLDTTSGTAYVGDTAGIRVVGTYIKAPTRHRISTWNCGRKACSESRGGSPQPSCSPTSGGSRT